jgi:hypothetical protein
LRKRIQKVTIIPIDWTRIRIEHHAKKPDGYRSMSPAYKMPNNPRYLDLWVECQCHVELLGAWVWKRHFRQNPRYQPVPDPLFVTSKRLGVPTNRMRKAGAYREIQGNTHWWGIVVSFNAYLNTPKKDRVRWLTNLLKHELVHYAGYWHHKPSFWEALKAIGGSN